MKLRGRHPIDISGLPEKAQSEARPLASRMEQTRRDALVAKIASPIAAAVGAIGLSVTLGLGMANHSPEQPAPQTPAAETPRQNPLTPETFFGSMFVLAGVTRFVGRQSAREGMYRGIDLVRVFDAAGVVLPESLETHPLYQPAAPTQIVA